MRKFSLYTFLVYIFLEIMTPIPQYIRMIIHEISSSGLSYDTYRRAINDTHWLARFFVGPPKDEEMITFLEKNAPDLEFLAKEYLNGAGRLAPPSKEERSDFAEVKRKLNVRVYSSGLSIPNSSTSNRDLYNYYDKIYGYGWGSDPGSYAVYLEIDQIGNAPWWMSSYSWEKSFLYVPDLIPMKGYSDDPIAVIRASRLIEMNLDRPPKKMEENPLDYPCAVRPVRRHWFISLCVVRNHKS